MLRSLMLDSALPASPGNRYADDEKAADLGHRVFFDEGFSRSGTVSCATCHVPQLYFTDSRNRAIGLAQGGRNTPTLIGAQWYTFFGWDGRVDSAWAQSLAALRNPAEHDFGPEGVAQRVESHYLADYENAFGSWPRDLPSRDRNELVFVNVGKALEAYIRRLVPRPAPFDAYVTALSAGDDEGGFHLSAAAQRGLRDFLRNGCVSCHHGPLFTDGEFHNLGLPPSIGASDVHTGRSLGARHSKASPYRCASSYSDADACDALRYLDPEFADFVGAFKTPTLRNVAETGPYMHTGQFDTLEAVIEFYRILPGDARVGRRDPQLRPLGRAVSPHDLAAFLRSLTGALPDDRWLGPPRRSGSGRIHGESSAPLLSSG